MSHLLRRGATYYARLFIPLDRWADVGRAFGTRNGLRREMVRTLETTDRAEAQRRVRAALTEMQSAVDAKLAAARLRPLTDWTASWSGRAVQLRAALQSAGNDPVSGAWNADRGGEEHFVGDSERDLIREQIHDEAQQLARRRGDDIARAFTKAITTDKITLQEAADAWLASIAGARRNKTVQGHRSVLANLERFLREEAGLQSLASTTFDDVTRRIAGDFIHWRGTDVSPAAVRREFSTPMGLWRWAVRRGHTDANPWTDQTAGLAAHSPAAEDATKRAFTIPELVTLIRAKGDKWAPNGGGYGATLWDATRLALLTGLRAAELADLRIKDVIESGAVISVPRGKTVNAPRLIPLPKAAREVVSARLADLPDKSPDAPLWPEIPLLRLTNSRGGKLSDLFRRARVRLLPQARNVDMHSLRRSYATMLEATMHGGGRLNPTLIATLIGHERGTLALDRYSAGAAAEVLKRAVRDLERAGIPAEVAAALSETKGQRPRMVRFLPATRGDAPAAVAIVVATKRKPRPRKPA